MAKKRFSTPNDLVNSLDDLSSMSPKQKKEPAKSKRKSFTQEPEVNARDIALAVDDKTMAGQYKRKQILIPPAQLDYIRQKAKELGLSQAALFRWLIDYGLTALDDGVVPEVEVVEVRGEAQKTHWTS
jgi:hypothetical protein